MTAEERPRLDGQGRTSDKIKADETSTYVQGTGSALRVPSLSADVDTLTAAMTYADNGWFVLPVASGSKHPGSVVGQGWPARSSRSHKQIAAWFAGANHGIALHAGRSGAVVFDVDHPTVLPSVITEAVDQVRAPFQSTRAEDSARGHYVLLQPEGRTIGNGTGRLGGAWGEVRGTNGVIIAAPSQHANAHEGGQYVWHRTGDVPLMPSALAGLLPDAGQPGNVADAATVTTFLANHNRQSDVGMLDHICGQFVHAVRTGASRHATAVDKTCWAMKEARAGFYPASEAIRRLQSLFNDVKPEAFRDEWAGIVRFAVGAAVSDDPNARRADVDARRAESTTFVAPTAPLQERERGRLGRRLLSREQVRDLPKPTPLIDGTLDRGTVAMLTGHTGTCKSFTALGWAASVATGRRWQHRRARHGTVIYVAAEGASGISPRLSAWETHESQQVPDTALLTLPMPANLGSPADLAELCTIVEEHRALFVVIDTLNRCAVGLEENSAKDMGRVVDALYTIQHHTDQGTVLLVHHTGKDKTTTRGSSALEDGVDAVYMATGDYRQVHLNRTKRKDGPQDDRLTLRLEPLAPSAVLVRAAVDMSPNEDHLLSVFLSNFSASGATMRDLRKASGLPSASFDRALKSLVRVGALVDCGTDHKPFFKQGDVV